MTKKLVSILLLFSAIMANAQTDLPKGFTEEEKTRWPDYLQNYNVNRNSEAFITPPNAQKIRVPGEWEEVEAVCITWTSYTSILKEIVRNAQQQCKVIISCTDSTQVKSYLASNNVPITANIKFLKTSFNSVWIRDYGPNGVYTNEVDSLILVDWVYNRPRPADDGMAVPIASYLGIPLYQTNTDPYKLVHTGGNFMADGFNTGFSSKLVLDENNTLSNGMVDTLMHDFMGINRYIKMNTLPYDGIHHIDMHIKLLDEETLLVGEYPSGISDGPQIEANLQYVLSNYTSAFGTPYKVVRIPMPSNNTGWPSAGGDYLTYTNSVILNKTVLVPVYTSGNTTQALQIYKDALPAGYKVVGINCNSSITASGALHCITKEIAHRDPLLISHQPLRDTYDTTFNYTVSAYIKHRSGISNAVLYYRTDSTQPYTAVAMYQGFNPDYWLGEIPAQPAGTSVYYYVEATAGSGKTMVRPITAPQGYWKFDVLMLTAQQAATTLQINRLYPNPSKGITVVEYSNTNPSPVVLTIKNLTGQVVYTASNKSMQEISSKFFVNTELYASGIYTVSIQSAKGIITTKLIVK